MVEGLTLSQDYRRCIEMVTAWSTAALAAIQGMPPLIYAPQFTARLPLDCQQQLRCFGATTLPFGISQRIAPESGYTRYILITALSPSDHSV
jgi:hypothetical protein